jgi:hypothetical protein
MPIGDPNPNEHVVDYTEPSPVTQIEGNEANLVLGLETIDNQPYMWRVELYLASKYAPEFVESTIFKMRSAALERAKIVKEHHIVMSAEQFSDQLLSDLQTYVQWTPPKSGGQAMVVKPSPPRPGIGNNYQRTLE